MTLTNFSKKFNISVYDMIEVLKCMGLFKNDYSNWSHKAYSEKLVSDMDNILEPKLLEKRVKDYRENLKNFLYSRTSKNEFDGVKLILKGKISKNKSLVNFVKGVYEEN